MLKLSLLFDFLQKNFTVAQNFTFSPGIEMLCKVSVRSILKRSARYDQIFDGNERLLTWWCNPLTLQLEQSGGQGSISGLAQLSIMTRSCGLDEIFPISAIPAFHVKNCNCTFSFTFTLF